MNDQGAHLAEDAFGNIARALSCKAKVEPIFAALFGDYLEGIQSYSRVFAAKTPAKEIVCFIEEDYDWAASEIARSCLRK